MLLATQVLTLEDIQAQGGSQNSIFVASGYLTQREIYRLGLSTMGVNLSECCCVSISFCQPMSRPGRRVRNRQITKQSQITGKSAHGETPCLPLPAR